MPPEVILKDLLLDTTVRLLDEILKEVGYELTQCGLDKRTEELLEQIQKVRMKDADDA
jgi:hypothetical protein